MMPLHLSPLESIFPILKVNLEPFEIIERLGTAFFVREDGVLMSAKHVLAVAPAHGEAVVAAFLGEPGKVSWHRITAINASAGFDIAIGRMEPPVRIHPLSIASQDPPHNKDVLTVEFSGTKPGPRTDFTPYHRKGHVVAVYDSDYGTPSTRSFDLSFPALKGSSGAPLILERDGTVVGMIVANVERYLLPAHIERLESPGRAVESHQYFLPTGQAISWMHLHEFLETQHPR